MMELIVGAVFFLIGGSLAAVIFWARGYNAGWSESWELGRAVRDKAVEQALRREPRMLARFHEPRRGTGAFTSAATESEGQP